MLKQHVSSLAAAGTDADIVSLDAARAEAALQPDRDRQDAPTVRDQLAREIADIEAATAALRRAEPALESWTKEATNNAPKPRPVWLLVGVLWLSTALVTAGAVVAIATLTG